MVTIIPGKEIKRMLHIHGIKIEDVAKAFNLHQSTVSRYFSDKLKMTPEFLFNLAEYSGIDINEFLVRDSGFHKEGEPVERTSMDVEKQDLIQLIRNMVGKIEHLEYQIEYLKLEIRNKHY
jgi:transcriptional regulator with XRE-family HTH domain